MTFELGIPGHADVRSAGCAVSVTWATRRLRPTTSMPVKQMSSRTIVYPLPQEDSARRKEQMRLDTEQELRNKRSQLEREMDANKLQVRVLIEGVTVAVAACSHD